MVGGLGVGSVGGDGEVFSLKIFLIGWQISLEWQVLVCGFKCIFMAWVCIVSCGVGSAGLTDDTRESRRWQRSKGSLRNKRLQRSVPALRSSSGLASLILLEVFLIE